MKAIIVSIFFFLFSTTSFATPKQEAFLNSLTYEEGVFITKVLASRSSYGINPTIQISMFKSYYVKELQTYCHDTLISKNNEYVNISACKIAGDWVFIFD